MEIRVGMGMKIRVGDEGEMKIRVEMDEDEGWDKMKGIAAWEGVTPKILAKMDITKFGRSPPRKAGMAIFKFI